MGGRFAAAKLHLRARISSVFLFVKAGKHLERSSQWVAWTLAIAGASPRR
jgi:hypothetical protein